MERALEWIPLWECGVRLVSQCVCVCVCGVECACVRVLAVSERGYITVDGQSVQASGSQCTGSNESEGNGNIPCFTGSNAHTNPLISAWTEMGVSIPSIRSSAVHYVFPPNVITICSCPVVFLIHAPANRFCQRSHLNWERTEIGRHRRRRSHTEFIAVLVQYILL